MAMTDYSKPHPTGKSKFAPGELFKNRCEAQVKTSEQAEKGWERMRERNRKLGLSSKTMQLDI
jgi:hypothetical protein